MEFFFEGHASEKSVDRFTAGHAVLVAVCPAVSLGAEVLYAGVVFWQWLVAKEATVALGPHQPIKRVVGIVVVAVSDRVSCSLHI
jgi:hypothetical protein